MTDDIEFDKWFERYCKRHGFTKEMIKGPLHELELAANCAWEACYKLYNQ